MSSTIVVPADTVLFEDLCIKLDSINRTQKKQEKFMILKKYIDDFWLMVFNITKEKNSSFYPILRLLLPALDRERSSYNLREKRLGVKLVEALAWDEESSYSQRLLNRSGHHKDFATVVSEVLKDSVCASSTLTVGDVNEILEKIANVESGKPPTLEVILASVLKKINVRQLKWLVRIILKDLKLGMGSERIFAAFHPHAEIYYNDCNDLKKVCSKFVGGNTQVSGTGVEIFHAIKPMLLDRLPITKLSILSPNKTYIIEEKFDGERFQIHMENNAYKYFSRRGNDYTSNFGNTYESGMLTPFLKDCFAPNVKSFILDGEMVGWIKEEEIFTSKAMKFDVKALKDTSKYKPSFRAFDVLYYNGKALVGPPESGGLPLMKRLEILDQLFQDIPKIILHSERQMVKEKLDIVAALNKSTEDTKEGITVKETESFYLPNRRKGGWYKTKSVYSKGGAQDFDLVIIGKSLRHPGSFYVACVDDSGASPRWLCMAAVQNLKSKDYETLCSRLKPHWRRAATHQLPPYLHFNKQHVDFWVPPEDSVVLQVCAPELVKCNNYGTPYTLRFESILEIRYDKPVEDVLTLEELEEIVSSNADVVKLSKIIHQEEIDSVVIPRKKRVKKILQVADQFRTKITGEVEVKSLALRGRKICILSDDIDCDKMELIRIVESHGGKHEENSGADTWCCVVGRQTSYVTKIIDSIAKDNLAYDIVSTSWLRSLPDTDEPCTLTPLDMMAIKQETRLKMSVDYDDCGDSYKDQLDVDTLKRCFEKMESDKPKVYLTTREKIKIDKELFADNNPFSFLRSCCLAFQNGNSIYAIRARMYGAALCHMYSANVTHVVLPKMAEINDKMEAKKCRATLVTEEWLDACFAENRRVPETSFVVL